MKRRPSAARVLLVDDDVWWAESQMRSLEGTVGCRVQRAADSIEAMRLIDESPPDLIVVDLFLPGPNAVALLHELQSYDDTSAIPVILCSNSADNLAQLADNLSSYGVRRILDKTTVTPEIFSQAVRECLA